MWQCTIAYFHVFYFYFSLLVCGVSAGLYGQNDREAALIDMINDQQEDMRVLYYRLIYKEYVCIRILRYHQFVDK